MKAAELSAQQRPPPPVPPHPLRPRGEARITRRHQHYDAISASQVMSQIAISRCFSQANFDGFCGESCAPFTRASLSRCQPDAPTLQLSRNASHQKDERLPWERSGGRGAPVEPRTGVYSAAAAAYTLALSVIYKKERTGPLMV